MPSTSVTVRMDADLKREAESMFNAMGLTMTTAITLFAKAVLNYGKLPFEVTAQPRYNAETEAAIQEARDIMVGKVQVPTYRSAKEMHAAILAETDDGEEG